MSDTQPPVVGIDIGGTNMQFGLVDGANQIIARSKKKTKAAQGTDAVIDRLVEGASELCETAGIEMQHVGAIGVACAGAIDIPKGIILNAPNLGWYDLPLRKILQEKTDGKVVLENDVNGAVWGEYKLGAGGPSGGPSGGGGKGDVLGVWIGTGVGGGLVLNGRIYHGDMFTAGEFGHTVIDPEAPHGRAKVEELCSRTGMSRTILSRMHAYRDSVLHELIDPGTGITGSKMLRKAIDAGDALAIDVVRHAADLLGRSISSVVTMLSLKRVIIGGGITEALGEPYLELIRESFREWVFPDQLRACEIVATQLEDDAGLLGAALLAREAAQSDYASS